MKERGGEVGERAGAGNSLKPLRKVNSKFSIINLDIAEMALYNAQRARISR
jgi:hypothetical protein